jgi:hypothetical protein
VATMSRIPRANARAAPASTSVAARDRVKERGRQVLWVMRLPSYEIILRRIVMIVLGELG